MTEPEAELLRSYYASERFQAGPDLEDRVRRALSAHPRRIARVALPSVPVPARLVGLAAAFLVLVLFGVVPGAAAPSGLAVLPRLVLGEVGAAPVVERLMPMQVSATSSGHTMSLVSAYADDERTILVLRIRPAVPDAILDQSYLVDSAGRHMQLRDEYPNDNGYYVASFEPMKSGHSAPAKLTLYTPRLATGASQGKQAIYGTWILQFTVTSQGGHTLPLPAPGRACTASRARPPTARPGRDASGSRGGPGLVPGAARSPVGSERGAAPQRGPGRGLAEAGGRARGAARPRFPRRAAPRRRSR